MASGNADVGYKTTVVFGTSPFTMDLTGVSMSGPNIAEVNKTAINQTRTTKQWAPGKLKDMGTCELSMNFDPKSVNSNPVPVNGTVEDVTVTFPVPSGLSSGATLAGKAFCTTSGWEISGEDELMTGTVTLRWTGLDTAGTADGPVYTDAS